MLLSAADEMNLDLGPSWIVGDRSGDLEAGSNAGIRGGVHVATGHGMREGERQNALALASSGYQAVAAPSLADIRELVDLFP